MASRNRKDIVQYVESSGKKKCTVISAKVKKSYNDLDDEIRIWNVKTKEESSWWVVEGDNTPMCLYTQDALYLNEDTAYSFHIGLMVRLNARDNIGYSPEEYVHAATLGIEIFPKILRKLKLITNLIDEAEEIEDFKSIGMQCREVLIDLGNHIYNDCMLKDEDAPKNSDFKKKAELFIEFYYKGSENSDYRSMIRKITDSVWDLSNKITHSNSSTKYETSTCVALCLSVVCAYENVMQKVFNPLSQYSCKTCASKKLSILDDESDDEGYVEKLILKCEECGNTTNIIFEKISEENPNYITGKPEL